MKRLKRCHCHGRRLCWWALVQLILFPLEHWPWDHLYPLTVIAKAIGV